MYAVVELAGHQYKVQKGDKLIVNRLEAKEGDKIDVKEVLLTFAEGDKDVQVGQPFVKAVVSMKVLEHKKGDKVRVFKKSPKKRREVNKGFRASQTVLEVVDIKAGAAKAKAAAPKKAEEKKEEAKAE